MSTIILGSAVPAHAQEDDNDTEVTAREGDWGATKKSPGKKTSSGDDQGTSDADAEQSPEVFTVGLGEDEDGNPCWRVVTGGTSSYEDAAETVDDYDDNGAAYDACPDRPSFDDILEATWLSQRCPPPTPSPSRFAPGWAIAGLRGYLEIGGPDPASITCLGETITAAPRYEIRWGDGHTTTTDSQGGPWPDGDVTHVYEDVATTEILVEAYWTGTWNGITFPELPVPTTETVPLEVREVQAVRQR